MSNNAELTKNSNEYNWIEDAISKKLIKYYEFEQFCDLQEIGFGGFGKVYRASWKNYYKQCALKSFFNFNDSTVKGIAREIQLQREVDFHNNIIRFYGVTTSSKENQRKNCQPSFHGKPYDVGLALSILQGLRETPTHDTPKEYIKIYIDCWNFEPDNRPTIDQVVEELKVLITKENVIIKDFHLYNNTNNTLSSNNHQLSNSTVKISESTNSLNGELQFIPNTKDIESLMSSSNQFENNFDTIVINTMFNLFNDSDEIGKKKVLSYLNEQSITLQ
ncbi:kinase-like domain-containing protein [Rhizophagus irregularis DAOM 181602=DAOM 197198]|nr:kinase-like domain-containing protein [Rhizophagus irregularis DAOM 181602=DAOM 197198]